MLLVRGAAIQLQEFIQTSLQSGYFTPVGRGRYASAVFADKKPLRLIHGGELLYLLEHHTDVKAKIEFPQEWVDPLPDMVEAEISVSIVKPPIDVMSDTSPISKGSETHQSVGITDGQSEADKPTA